MAKSPASDSVMTPERMKPLLAMSKHEPVQAAIGLTTDGDGLIFLHKKAKPKTVLSMLRAEAKKAKLALNNASMRFGRALVDNEYDPGMVRFFINKDAPGTMRVKLVEVVKRIPYQKIELNVDPSLEDEPEDDAEERVAEAPDGVAGQNGPAQAPSASAPQIDLSALTRELAGLIGRISQSAGEDAGRKAQLAALAGDANGKIKATDLAAGTAAVARLREALDALQPTARGESATPEFNPDALKKDLLALAGRIAGAAGEDMARKARLAKLAGDGNLLMKAGNFGAAAKLLGLLREALDEQAGPGAGQVGGGAGLMQAWKAASDAWRDANDSVNDQINGLRSALLASAEEFDTPELAELAKSMSVIAENGLNEITEDHRVKLLASVMELDDGAPEKMQKFAPKALDMIAAFQGFLAGSAKIALCDDNPFGVPMSIRGTFEPALVRMAAILGRAAAPTGA